MTISNDTSTDDVCRLLALLSGGSDRAIEGLSNELAMSAAHVRKLTAQAASFGAQIRHDESQNTLSWRNPFELFDHDRITALLHPKALELLGNLVLLNSIDSTNRYVLDVPPQDTTHGMCCLAEVQSAGRGRRGKSWLSPIGNIALSVGWRTNLAPPELTGLSLAIGVAVCEALEASDAKVSLKWPNDVLHDGKKVAGILIETQKLESGEWLVVIGVGLNVLHTPDDAAAGGWTDLARMLARRPDRTSVVANLISAVLLALDLFEATGFAGFMDRWNCRHAMRGRRVELKGPDTTVVGTALDVDEHGAFRLEVGGTIHNFETGTLSLRLAP